MPCAHLRAPVDVSAAAGGVCLALGRSGLASFLASAAVRGGALRAALGVALGVALLVRCARGAGERCQMLRLGRELVLGATGSAPARQRPRKRSASGASVSVTSVSAASVVSSSAIGSSCRGVDVALARDGQAPARARAWSCARPAVSSSSPVACWKRSPNRSRRGLSTCSTQLGSSVSVAQLHVCVAITARRPLAVTNFVLDGQLVAGQAHRLAGQRLRHAGELEHHAAGLHHRDPALRRALAGAHAGLGGLLGVGLVGEDVDPDLAATLDLAGHRDTGGLDLAVRSASPPPAT